MADRSTGPVKPPVIDLTARNTNARSRRSGRPRPQNPPPAPPRAHARALATAGDANWPLLGGVAVAGAVLGTILTYLLANALPLPARGPDARPHAATDRAGRQLDALTRRAHRPAADARTRTQVSLDATIAQLDTGLADAQPIDRRRARRRSPSPQRRSISRRSRPSCARSRRRSMRSRPAPRAPMPAPSPNRSPASRPASPASPRVSTASTRPSRRSAPISTRRAQRSATTSTAALPNEVGPALKLPLILSGLEGAFATGKPFQLELDASRTVLPDFAVPDTLSRTQPPPASSAPIRSTRSSRPRCPTFSRRPRHHQCRLDAERRRLGQVAAGAAARRRDRRRQPRGRRVAPRSRDGAARLCRAPLALLDALAAADARRGRRWSRPTSASMPRPTSCVADLRAARATTRRRPRHDPPRDLDHRQPAADGAASPGW